MCEFYMMTRYDLPWVLEIENNVAASPWGENIFTDCLDNNQYRGVVIRVSEQNIGFAMLSVVLDELHLLNIAISTSWQGKGYGRKLLHYIIEQAKLSNLKQIFLEVRLSNKTAQSLYLSKGFNEIDCRKNYYPAAKNQTGHEREDALIYALQIL